LISSKKFELSKVWVTNKSKASKIIKLAFLILRGFDFQSGALSGSQRNPCVCVILKAELYHDHNVIPVFV